MGYILVNIFSAMSEHFPVFFGCTSTKLRIKCLAQVHNSFSGESQTRDPSIQSLTLYHCAPLTIKFKSWKNFQK